LDLYLLNKKINPQIITGNITTGKVNLTPHPKPIKKEANYNFLVVILSSTQNIYKY